MCCASNGKDKAGLGLLMRGCEEACHLGEVMWREQGKKGCTGEGRGQDFMLDCGSTFRGGEGMVHGARTGVYGCRSCNRRGIGKSRPVERSHSPLVMHCME